MNHQVLVRSCAAFLVSVLWAVTSPAQGLSQELLNGSMEKLGPQGRPTGWNAPGAPGVDFELTDEDKFEGEFAARIDTTANDSPAPFVLNQGVSPEKLKGNRVQLRAAVRTADRVGMARAQLWMRVDRRDGDQVDTLAFDNMDPRPIRGDEWAYYSVTLDVAEDATGIALGMFVIGKAVVWIDDVTLSVVDSETKSTNMLDGKGVSQNARRSSSIDPVVMKALREADNAPQQPFWNPWLWFVAVGMVLMMLGERKPSLINTASEGEPERFEKVLGGFTKFAFRFTFCYWLFYIVPQPFVSLSNRVGAYLMTGKKAVQDRVVPWVAENALGIERELVPPNGSGDTTYNYVWVLMVFVAAMGAAIVWTIADRRRTDYRICKDLMRSYVRYFVAITMLGYGMAKATYLNNQFPVIQGMQLDQTWGDSSPMGVVWRFMGASRPYTVFAGVGEIVGGFLLMFRRTTLLGAMVTFGVMTNVMMLNYCYDVPVKLLSTHLVVMALYLMLPDLYGRLGSVLLWNQRVEPSDFRPPYVNQKTIWVQRGAKSILLLMLLVIPLYKHAKRQLEYLSEAGTIEQATEGSRLKSRGYRWVNEVPYNR